VRLARWIALLLCAAGAAAVALGLRQAARGRDTVRWTRTLGRVVASRVEEQGGPEEQGYPRFRFEVRYAYEARGRAHEGDQLWIGSRLVAPSQDRAWHQALVDRYPVGREVEVWFDPADPAQAVLVRGSARGDVVALVAAGVALLGAGLFVLGRAPGR
jgi:hypothetical protein